MRSCLKLIGFGTLLVAGLVAAWLARDQIASYVSDIVGRRDPPFEAASSNRPALARRAEEKIVALGQGEFDEATLNADELNAWIQYGLRGFFPSYVSDVAATIEEERLVLAGRVVLQEVPGIEGMGPWVAFLGDTASVSFSGRLDGLRPGAGVYFVDDVQVGALPLPVAMRDQLLAQLKGGSSGELPTNAVAFELPEFVTDVGVREDLIFLRSSIDRSH
ncbi:MAG: hypothetical protein GTO46_03000 [Gemmatimonadetes bacterium]|nr:hypothetical protein [Gemmatimonadota bacterium]NIO30751.1 hypothetical protein [Gemmatimonadota bacterium]